MREILLMSPSLYRLDSLELRQLRKHIFKQAGLVKKPETNRRLRSNEYLVQLLYYPFLGQDRHPVLVSLYRLYRLGNYRKLLIFIAQLCREPYRTDHSQRIVAVCRVRIQRRTDDSCSKVPDASERIDQRSEILLLKAESHRIYREISSELIVLQCTVLNDRLAGIPAIRLLSRSDKLDLYALELEHGSSEVLEHRHIAVYTLSDRLGQFNSASLHDDIYVLARTSEETVTHIAADHEGTHPFLGRNLRNNGKYLMIQVSLCYCC